MVSIELLFAVILVAFVLILEAFDAIFAVLDAVLVSKADKLASWITSFAFKSTTSLCKIGIFTRSISCKASRSPIELVRVLIWFWIDTSVLTSFSADNRSFETSPFPTNIQFNRLLLSIILCFVNKSDWRVEISLSFDATFVFKFEILLVCDVVNAWRLVIFVELFDVLVSKIFIDTSCAVFSVSIASNRVSCVVFNVSIASNRVSCAVFSVLIAPIDAIFTSISFLSVTLFKFIWFIDASFEVL